MLIVGERLNSSIKDVGAAIQARDLARLRTEAVQQAEAGAHYLDVNAATMTHQESECLQWLIPFVQEASGLPLAIDSPNPAAIAAGLAVHRGRALLNSITGEQARLDALLPLVREHRPRMVALCMDDQGMPRGVNDRLRVAHRLVAGLTGAGVAEDDIFLDPLLKPIGVDPDTGVEVLASIAALRQEFPRCHIILGLSNVSFGMPKGRWLNRAFLAMAMGRGLDSVFCNPADQALMSLVAAARVLLGQDDGAAEYMAAFRAGRLA